MNNKVTKAKTIKNIMKKVIVAIIFTLMMFASCSQTIFLSLSQISVAENAISTNTSFSSVLTIYNGTEDDGISSVNGIMWTFIHNFTGDYMADKYKTDIYCMNSGMPGKATYTTKYDLVNDDCSNLQYKNGYSVFKNANDNGLKWLARNMYPSVTTVTKTEKKLFKENLVDIMNYYNKNNANYKDVNELTISDSVIQTVQKFAVWQMVNNDCYQPQNESFIDNFYINGNKISQEDAKQAKALYVALLAGARDNLDGDTSVGIDERQYTFNININNAGITQEGS